VVGAAALQLLSEATRVYVRAFSGFDLMIYGAILVVVIIFLPQGLAEGLCRPFAGRARRGAA
jgi:branched-chain amino acid transport system permease protein